MDIPTWTLSLQIFRSLAALVSPGPYDPGPVHSLGSLVQVLGWYILSACEIPSGNG